MLGCFYICLLVILLFFLIARLGFLYFCIMVSLMVLYGILCNCISYYKKKKKENKELQEQINILTEKVKDNDIYKHDNQALKKENKELQEQVNTLTKKVKDNDIYKHDNQALINQKDLEIKKLEQKIIQYDLLLKDYDKVEKLLNENNNNKQKIDELKNNIYEYTSFITEHLKEIDSQNRLQKEYIKDLTEDKILYIDLLVDYERLKEENEKYKKDLSDKIEITSCGIIGINDYKKFAYKIYCDILSKKQSIEVLQEALNTYALEFVYFYDSKKKAYNDKDNKIELEYNLKERETKNINLQLEIINLKSQISYLKRLETLNNDDKLKEFELLLKSGVIEHINSFEYKSFHDQYREELKYVSQSIKSCSAKLRGFSYKLKKLEDELILLSPEKATKLRKKIINKNVDNLGVEKKVNPISIPNSFNYYSDFDFIDFWLAGVQYREDKDAIIISEKLKKGDELLPVAEPDNIADFFAVAIYYRIGTKLLKIGYVEREKAFDVRLCISENSIIKCFVYHTDYNDIRNIPIIHGRLLFKK